MNKKVIVGLIFSTKSEAPYNMLYFIFDFDTIMKKRVIFVKCLRVSSVYPRISINSLIFKVVSPSPLKYQYSRHRC